MDRDLQMHMINQAIVRRNVVLCEKITNDREFLKQFFEKLKESCKRRYNSRLQRFHGSASEDIDRIYDSSLNDQYGSRRRLSPNDTSIASSNRQLRDASKSSVSSNASTSYTILSKFS